MRDDRLVQGAAGRQDEAVDQVSAEFFLGLFLCLKQLLEDVRVGASEVDVVRIPGDS